MSSQRSFDALAWLRVGLTVLPFSGLAASPTQTLDAPQHKRPPAQVEPQRAQVTYKAEVNYVEVVAVVTDANGRFVGDLARDDFSVNEDGTAQTISDFRLVNLDGSQPTAPRATWPNVEEDVSDNAIPFDGRVYVLLLDDLHVDPALSGEVRRRATRFVEHYLADGDMAAVVSTSGRSGAAQELTRNRSLLVKAVSRFMGLKGIGVPDPDLLFDETVTASVPGGRGALATDALSSLRSLVDLLGSVKGRRKAVVYFSEGPSFCAVNTSVGELTKDAAAVAAAAARANVAIYGVDPRGLDPSMDCDLDAGIRSLRGLADATGGFALVNSNDFDGGFERIRKDNSAYYVLGYYAAPLGPDVRFRKIDITISRPGLTVRALQGYLPLPAKLTAIGPGNRPSSPALAAAMNSALPVSGLRLAGIAVPFMGTTGHASTVTLALVVDGRDLTSGEIGPSEHTVLDMPLSRESHATVAREGIRVIRTVTLKPGLHQIRIGATDVATGRTGVIHCDLDVPDYRSLPLSMSGLLISSSLAGLVPIAPGGPLRISRSVCRVRLPCLGSSA
jgi:VWFA-related protein